jgi:hypothetical protein
MPVKIGTPGPLSKAKFTEESGDGVRHRDGAGSPAADGVLPEVAVREPRH